MNPNFYQVFWLWLSALCNLRLLLAFLLIHLFSAAAFSEVNSFQVSGVGQASGVVFHFRLPVSTPKGVLLLVPGYNGSGEAIMDDRWSQFADEQGLILLAPTFRTTLEELKRGKGYYYPEQGSGLQVERALAELGRRTGFKTNELFIFGFSAGAHFAHRFALWKPDRVGAFVAYSAAWWSDPKATLKDVPALIMCGESDERYEATRSFMDKALTLELPWVWRSYRNTGHELTPAVRSLAEVFLAHYANQLSNSPHETSLYGDIQSYRTLPAAAKDSIPAEVRIALPSKAVAETWVKEK